jgi:dTMP kinase
VSGGPYFIVVEGLDGAGKSTQINHLRDYFQARGEGCRITAEPTELPTGKLIRSVLRRELRMDPRALAALFAADPLEHIQHPDEGILRSLADGYHVIASRYYFSSLAYQSEFAEPGWIAALNAQAKRLLPADLTIFLDLDPTSSMQRIRQRSGEHTELFERLEKLRHVRESFLVAFERFGGGENIVHLNADRPQAEVARDIEAAVLALA